ncbi:hypothetical protein [Acinetobacter nosocomialis]|uniref:hypothetical protein n=1 Tax=Acinetobacter nosocomialis TaxID=106654 RepID=UPI0020918B05|nr:hypothetical protein [Acinetobacter nosocomialis]
MKEQLTYKKMMSLRSAYSQGARDAETREANCLYVKLRRSKLIEKFQKESESGYDGVMRICMNNQEALNIIAGGDMNANSLLNWVNPNFEKQFKELAKGFEKLMKDIRKSFPDANYFIAGDGVVLMLGHSHSDTGKVQRELMAVHGGLVGMSSGEREV